MSNGGLLGVSRGVAVPLRRVGCLTLSAAVLAAGCGGTPRGQADPPVVTATIALPSVGNLGPRRPVASTVWTWKAERLTGRDPAKRHVPRLLEGWSTSADGLTWRLLLRPDVIAVDGTALTNTAVAKAIEEFVSDPDTRRQYVCLPHITGVAAEGGRDIVVRLSARCYYLLDDLFDIEFGRSRPGAMNVDITAFRDERESESEVVMAANPRYFLGRPAIDRVVMRAYGSFRAPWADMLRGQVDVLYEVGPDAVEFLQQRSSIVIRSWISVGCQSVMFNLKRPALRSPEVRRALAMAVDRSELVRLGLRGYGVPADVPVWPGSWAFDSRSAQTPFDPAAARALLRRHPRLRFTCVFTRDYGNFERLALLVQRQLGAVGVEVELEAVPAPEFIERMMRGEFDAALIDPDGGSSLSILHRFWHTPDPDPRLNLFHYSNAAVDAALDEMRVAAGDDEFRAALGRFTAAIRDDPPGLFIAFPRMLQAVNRRFVIPPDADGQESLLTLGRWQLRAEEPR